MSLNDLPTLPPTEPDATTAPDPRPAAAARTDVPGYDMLGELGRGGMGVVYKARHVRLGRIVALKMILSGGHAGADGLARFRTEAEAIARLQHAGIVQVFEIGEHDGLPFFSLEFCAGGSLEKKLAGKPLPPREAATLVEQLSRAMHAAHEARVVHRDLKPANVLLMADGTPKVTDFGLAKKTDEQGQTQTGSIMGTPSYMSPEQAAGAKDVGPPADVYALGAILYECLTGRPPFRAATAFDTIMQVIGDEPVPPSRLTAGVPRDLETIALKCLRKEPAKRYRSAAALADDLRSFLADEPIRARPVSLIERGWRWAWRHPVVSALIALVILTAAGGAIAVLDQWRKKATEYTRAEEALGVAARRAAEAEAALEESKHSLYVYRILRAQRDLNGGLPGRAATLLDECPPALRGWEWYHLRHQLSGELARCDGHLGAVVRAVWSADGRTLFTGGTDGTVRLWSSSGEEKRVLAGHKGTVTALVPSQDGKRLAVATTQEGRTGGPLAIAREWSATGEIRFWDLQTGRVLRTFPGRFTTAVSADGKRVAGSTGRGVAMWEADSGKELWSRDKAADFPVMVLSFHPDGKRLFAAAYDAAAIQPVAWSRPEPIVTRAQLRVLDATTGATVGPEFTAPAGITGFGWLAGGKTLVAGTLGTGVLVWDAAKGGAPREHRLHGARMQGLGVTPEGDLVTIGQDRRLVVSDPTTGKTHSERRLHGLVVALGPDGRYLAVTGPVDDPTVRIYDGQSLGDARTLLGPKNTIAGVGFRPDARRFAAVGNDRFLRIWDTADWRELQRVPTRALRVLYTPDGKSLITGGEPALLSAPELAVRDPETGAHVRSLTGPRYTILGLSCSADGRYLASTSCLPADKAAFGHILVHDLHGGDSKPVLTIPSPAHTFAVAISPDGSTIAGACKDNTVRLWDRASGREVRALRDHTSSVNAIAFRPDGRQLASGDLGGTVVLWDVEGWTPRHKIQAHVGGGSGIDGGVVTLAYSRDGSRVASASFSNIGSGEVKVWDTRRGIEVFVLPGQLAVAFGPDGRTLAAAAGGGARPYHVRVAEAEAPDETRVLPTPVGIRSLSSGGGLLAEGGDDGVVRVWDPEKQERVREFHGHTGQVTKVALSGDGKRVASSGADGSVRMWDVESGKALATVPGKRGPLTAVALSSRGQLAAGGNGFILLSAVDRPDSIWAVGWCGKVASLAFSPDGKRIAIGGEDPQVRDAVTAEVLLHLDTDGELVRSIAYSPDGTRLYTAQGQGNVRAWDAETGRQLYDVPGHDREIFALAPSPDGRFLACVGDRRLAQVRDARGGKWLASVPGHEFWVGGVAFVGDRLASGGGKGGIRLTRLPPADPTDPPPATFPENATYLGRMARQAFDAGKPAAGLLGRWDQLEREQNGRSHAGCVAMLALTQSGDEAQATMRRLASLMRNEHWAKADDVKALYRRACEKHGTPPADEAADAFVGAVQALFYRQQLGPYERLVADDFRFVRGRAEAAGRHDSTLVRAEHLLRLRLYTSVQPNHRWQMFFEDMRAEDEGARRYRVIFTGPGFFVAADERVRLRKEGDGWRMVECRNWPIETRLGRTRTVHDEAYWKACDAGEGPEALLDGRRYREAFAAAGAAVKKPGATVEDWLVRARTAFEVGDRAALTEAVRRVRALDPNAWVPPEQAAVLSLR